VSFRGRESTSNCGPTAKLWWAGGRKRLVMEGDSGQEAGVEGNRGEQVFFRSPLNIWKWVNHSSRIHPRIGWWSYHLVALHRFSCRAVRFGTLPNAQFIYCACIDDRCVNLSKSVHGFWWAIWLCSLHEFWVFLNFFSIELAQAFVWRWFGHRWSLEHDSCAMDARYWVQLDPKEIKISCFTWIFVLYATPSA